MSTLNVDKVDPSTGTTLELGTSGDTVNLGSGVTAGTGFGGDLSFGGDTFGANKVIGANDAYSFSLETSGNTALTIDSTGAVTKPLQPAFFAYSASGQSNLAVTTAVTIIFDTEKFDNNADFNTTNYTFTAPVTGRYCFSVSLRKDNIDSAASYYQTIIYTSNTEYYRDLFDPGQMNGDLTYWQQQGTLLVDMDASDTCIIKYYQSGGTQQTDISGGDGQSSFQGWLVC